MRRTLTLLTLTLAAVVSVFGTAPAQDNGALNDRTQAGERIRTEPWPQEVLDHFARIPIQSDGRVKPLHTLAGFLMLRLNGKRSFTTSWDEKLSPTAWVLDCLFFPEQAWHYKVIAIDDWRVLDDIGVARADKKRRDRYSLAELEPGFDRLTERGGAIRMKEAKERSGLETQVLHLASKLPELRYLLGHFDFARHRIKIAGVPAFETVFGKRNSVSLLEFGRRYAEVSDSLTDRDTIMEIRRTLDFAKYIKFLQPTDPANEEYESPEKVLDTVFGGGTSPQFATLERIEKLAAGRNDFAALGEGIIALHEDLEKRATMRGEYDKIDLEVRFYEADWFYRGLWGFLAGFLLLSVFWIKPTWKLLYWGAWGSCITGEAMLVIGIVIRCILRERPPVTTTYEVILFVISVGVLIMLFTEYTRRNGLPLWFTGVIGALGIMLANWQEREEGVDTLQPLVAVLDTNYWLSIHVTTVVLGYCAGALAAVIAHLYIFGKLLGLRRGDKKYYADLSRIIYGVLCFGLLFSTVGTILGGVWANDSWGRFWGWDPKENGALMLVLGYLVVMHARMGGYLREHGTAVAAVVIGIIVVWAFWGVNLYGIGLHSYGFDETKKAVTNWTYGVEWIVVALGILTWGLQRRRQ